MSVEFVDGFEHGDDVLGGDFRQDVMNAVEDKAALGREDRAAFQHMPADLVGRGFIQHRSRVAPATPEGNVPAEFALQRGRVHLDAVGLHGIDDVISRVNQIG